MSEIIYKALRATRESKYIEFKRAFDTTSPGEWCEIIKDIVALANSGGGILVFGLDSNGKPTGEPLDSIAREDPANILDKVSKYIEAPSFEIESHELKKHKHTLHALVISGSSIPHIFQKPGSYDVGGGKQKTAFGVGTIYFRHGAKSEHGNSHDLRTFVERQLNLSRKAWVKGLRQVVQAPSDSEIVAIPRASIPTVKSVRATKDLKAQPVLLTRDPTKAEGAIFYHEEISEGIFDEINNVIDANAALAKRQRKFHLGQGIYHRIYAERQHVRQDQESLESLLGAGLLQFYAPWLFWMLRLPEQSIVGPFLDLYRNRSPQIHALPRIATILGEDFSKWLLGKLNKKFARRTQPPSFYWVFKNSMQGSGSVDYRLRAAHLPGKWRSNLPTGQNANLQDLLGDPLQAASLLSAACLVAFEYEKAESRTIARSLDYLAYGAEIRKRAKGMSDAVIQAVREESVGELINSTDDRESDLQE